jgi:hypothetical protein
MGRATVLAHSMRTLHPLANHVVAASVGFLGR